MRTGTGNSDTITIESRFKRRVILPPDLSKLTHPGEGRTDPGAGRGTCSGAGADCDARRTHRGAGGAARRVELPGEDAGQFVQAAPLARPEAGGSPANRSPTTQEPPRCRADATSEPRSRGRCQAGCLPEVSDGIRGSRADPAAGLRAHRVAPDQAGRDAGASDRRLLRLLRRAGECRSPSRARAGFAVWSIHRRVGGLSALRSRHRHGTAVNVDGRDLFAVDQRGCDQQHAGPCA